MTTSEQIVEEFIAKGWKANPFDKLIPMLRDERDQALPLALMVIERVPKGGTFFDFLLSHLSENEFKTAVQIAVDRLKANPTEGLESVIAYASVQFPSLLTPHLRELFTLHPNAGTYYEAWPWRAADDGEIEILKELVLVKTNQNSHHRAWRCLLETRRPDVVEFAARHFPPELDRGGGVESYAQLVGFDVTVTPPQRLHAKNSHHIIFPERYFDESDRPAWIAHANHPTWVLKGHTASSGDFGGEAQARCAFCNGILHRLLRIEGTSSVLDIRVPKLDICTCLSCLGWEQTEMFFLHDGFGVCSALAPGVMLRTPEFPATPLKSTSVFLVPSPPRWEAQDWALSNGRENLNRIGGAPAWIQNAQHPNCPQCQKIMGFIAQFDSNLPTSDGGEWLWGSGGICYVFWCDECAVSANLWQCT